MRAFGKPLELTMNRHAEPRQHGEIAVHGVRAGGSARGDNIVVESCTFARAFAVVVQSDAEVGIGEPGEEAAAGETLEIDGDIKSLRANLADGGIKFRPISRRSPAFAMKGENAGEIGVVGEQWNEAGFEPPGYLAIRPMELEQAQH